MQRRSRPGHGPIRRFARGAIALGIVAAGLPAWARTGSPLPEGIAAGRFVLAPYASTSMGYDDNLYRVSDDPQSEVFTLTTLGIAARLPVRNSWLQLRYQADWRDYSSFQAARPREDTFGAAFQFNLGSGDTIIIQDNYMRGASDVLAVDAGGELLFRDEPFDLNRAEIVWQRTTPGLSGFAVRVAHVDLEFQDVGAPFFDYNGIETAVEYRHPIPGRRWLRGYFESRRFDHLENRQLRREEHADTLQVGMAGWFGRGHSFDFRAGYGRYRLLGEGAEFQGLVGRGNLTLVVGGRTRVLAVLWRRPLPSNLTTYYIVNSLRLSAERNVARNVVGGVAMEYWRNGYLDPLEAPGDEKRLENRDDERYVLEGYLDWFLHPRMGFRLAAGHQQRISTFEPIDGGPPTEPDVFRATGVSLSLRLGWF